MNNIPESEASRIEAGLRNAMTETASRKMAWHKAALSAGLYRGDEDVSTPEKWLSAQLRAYKRLKVPPFDREDGS